LREAESFSLREAMMSLKTIIVCVLLFLGGSAVAQQSGSLGAESLLPNCDASCVPSPGICHHQRAAYLLRGFEYSMPECLLSQVRSLSRAGEAPRIEQGLVELEKAISDPSGLRATRTELQVERADALISLAYAQIRATQPRLAGETMKRAEAAYQAIVEPTGESQEVKPVLPRIAEGLIRSGAIPGALTLLTRLPPSDPQRLYLWAEALFSIGAREDAANGYEQWIVAGCSTPTMLTDNEFGEQWTLLSSKKPANLKPCEQLPKELRTRLETLRQEFHHPNNLPAQNHEGILFPARADF
jgi:hypothetical protein